MPKRTALIATLPKSGTWYCHSFFWSYEQLVCNENAWRGGSFKPDLGEALRTKKIANLTHHRNTLGIDDLFICHSICPGFAESGDERMKEWRSLYFPLPSNWGEAHIRKHKGWDALNPATHPDARIVYLFRNPLDHFVSFFRHTLNHKDARHRMKRLPDGSSVPIKDLHDFVFDFGMLGSFIKHYYSFKRMHELYPSQILMMPYERLTATPKEAFVQILSFLGTPMSDDLIGEALKMSSKESLMAIEAKIGHSIANDQMKGEKHIRNGGTGGWSDQFSSGELEIMESVFAAFGITLGEFNITGAPGTAQDLSWLSTISPKIKEMHQADFFWAQRQNPSAQSHSSVNDYIIRTLGGVRRGLKHFLPASDSTVADEAEM